MTSGVPSQTNISILYNSIFNTIRFMMDENSQETYNVWLCQEADAKLYFVQAVQFNTRIEAAEIRPIKMLAGWAPNQSDPGSLFVYLLNEIKNHFGLDSILPIADGGSGPRFTDPPWYIK